MQATRQAVEGQGAEPHEVRPASPSPCQVCRSADHARIEVELPECRVTRCRACGFVYLSGDRSPEAEHELYRCDHFESDGYLTQMEIDRIVEEQMESLQRILSRAGAEMPARDGQALDVGCARGHFLEALRTRTAWTRVQGIDVSEDMVAKGKSEFHLDLRAIPVEEADFAPASLDLVTMFDVLEHVARPPEVLSRLMTFLKPGGWIVLEVPSETTVFRWLTRTAYSLSGGRIEAPLRALYHPNHLSYFTRGSLSRLIDSLGGTRITMVTKEAHVTRFGLGRYGPPARLAIRAVTGIDKMMGTEAKILAAFQKPG